MRTGLGRRFETWVSGSNGRGGPERTSARRFTVGGRLWAPLRPYLDGSIALLWVLCVVALCAGFVEAGLIFLIVRTAALLTAGGRELDITLGPLDDQLSSTEGLLVAAALVVVLVALNTIVAVIAAQVSGASLNRGRHKAMRDFLGSGWEAQSREAPGALQDLLTNNVSRISQGVLALIVTLTGSLGFAALMVSAILIDVGASLVILATVVAVGALLSPLTRLTKRMSAKGQKRHQAYATRVSETVDLAREIDLFGVGGQVADLMDQRADAVTRAGFVTRVLLRVTPALFQSAVMGVLIAGMAVVEANSSRVASLGSIVILMVRGLGYSQQVNSSIQQLSEISPYVEELQRKRMAYRAAVPHRGEDVLARVERLRVEHLVYEYEPGTAVVDDVSFNVDAGEVVGIVGPSGSGKSTLIQVLLRLRAPTGGRYLVNDLPAESYDPQSWAKAASLVPQENVLLRGTVSENIRFFRAGIDDASVDRAAALAHVRDEILALPRGFDTEIGRGVLDLSGGQRQRLGLARALCTEPQLLVLDEPTSALDMQSEALIQQSLWELKGRLTLFVIAHRITTLSNCDRIMVLERGRLTAIGTFDEMLRSSPFFKEAVRLSRLPA